MRIKIIKSGDTYSADFEDLPGSPPMGEGATEAEAVAVLFFRLFTWDKCRWIEHAKRNCRFVQVMRESE